MKFGSWFTDKTSFDLSIWVSFCKHAGNEAQVEIYYYLIYFLTLGMRLIFDANSDNLSSISTVNYFSKRTPGRRASKNKSHLKKVL